MHNLDQVLTKEDIEMTIEALTIAIKTEYSDDRDPRNSKMAYNSSNIETYLTRSINWWENEVNKKYAERDVEYVKILECDTKCQGVCRNYSQSHYEAARQSAEKRIDDLDARITKGYKRIELRKHQLGLIEKLKLHLQ